VVKVQFGDIVEIRTRKGLAYAQYTHRHENYGALIRVFDRLYKSRPADIAEVASNPVRFTTFFPLQAAVNRHIVDLVGKVRVPERLQAFPLFRDGVADPPTGRVAVWWLWDGEREWRVGKLTSEQRRLPIRGIWNDTFLVERIEEGWRPENDRR